LVISQTCEHDNSKTDELILLQIGTSSLWEQGNEMINFWGQEVKGQRHTMPKLDLEIMLDPFSQVGFLVLSMQWTVCLC